MGLLTGGLSFRRYRVVTQLPEDFRDLYLENIGNFAFHENLRHRSKEPLFGWVNVANPDDIAFNLNKILFDRYLVLGLRMDKKAVNGKLFQILLERRFREVMAEKGVERLGKNHKQEIKEALEEELLSETLPSVNTYDLAWDIHTGEVLLFATSDSVIEIFQGLCHDTFGIRLYPERMVDWLAEKLPWDQIVALADAALPGGAAEKNEELTEDGWHQGNPLKNREFMLGSEFLTWLWHESELRDGSFILEGPPKPPPSEGSAITERDAFVSDDEVDYDYRQGEQASPLSEPVTRKGSVEDREELTLWLDNKLTFKDLEGVEEPGVTTMTGPAPSTSPEARLSMVSGKRPVEARLGLRRGEYDWFFTLRVGPGGLELNGLKLPIEVKDGDEEKILERMYLLDVISSAIRELFRQFYLVRASDRWPGLIDKWIEEEKG